MKLKIIKTFFGADDEDTDEINLIGPCIICARMNKKTKKCKMTDKLIPQEHMYNYEFEEVDGVYYSCQSFEMRKEGRKQLI